MDRICCRLVVLVPNLILVLASLTFGQQFLVDIQFNTDDGTVTVDGVNVTTINGVPFQTSVVDGIQQFRFLGDLNILAGQTVSGIGSRPLSLFAGDNINVDQNAAFIFSTNSISDQFSHLGGGDGGSGNLSVGAGGPRVSGGTRGIGGDGGRGGTGRTIDSDPGEDGEDGTRGDPGKAGGLAKVGYFGGNGSTGFNNPGVGGLGGAGGLPGISGNPGLRPTSVGIGGDGGSGGGFNSDGGDGGFGGSCNGCKGGDGTNGIIGAWGAAGAKGAHAGLVTGLKLSAGKGGGGGGSGGGGGGGGSGAGGSGGGGGGGGGGGADFGFPSAGASGSYGGDGGNGGRGGKGGDGGFGGNGGGGGGAVEIRANGKITFAGSITIRGGAGTEGSGPFAFEQGLSGAPFTEGGPLVLGFNPGGNGGAGGPGGNGGRGGNGGPGGNGGHGGGGAGGMVMFRSTLFNASGAVIDTLGGSNPSGVRGDNGRYAVGANNAIPLNYGVAVGNSVETYLGEGGARINPFIDDETTETYNIAGLVGGADTFGILKGVNASDSFFQTVRIGAPANARAAIMRVDAAPNGEPYLQDMLLFVNLSQDALLSPQLGIGGTHITPLLQRGFLRDPEFGGIGPIGLGSLSPGAVYATLFPGPLLTLNRVNASIEGTVIQNAQLNPNEVVYLVPGIRPGDFDFNGIVNAADYVVLRNGFGTRYNQDDYNIWRANFGRSAGSGSTFSDAKVLPVPEPSSLLVLMIAVILRGGRRAR